MIVPEFLNRIIELARRGTPGAFPNPLVGALLEIDGSIIGEGWHHRYGKAHAEVNAVAAVPNPALLRNATLYVTLEPCNHQGKTPPCVDLILYHGIPRVIVGTRDPFPEVDGKGIERLRQHGVSVTMAPDPAPFDELIRFFRTNVLRQRPYLTLKVARSSDGFIAALNADGTPVRTSISGAFAAYHTHGLRAVHQAILIGGNTFRTDQPVLNNRYFPGPSPVRIILSNTVSEEQLSPWMHGGQKIILISEKQMHLPHPHHRCMPGKDLKETLTNLWLHERIGSILVEGGNMVLTSLLNAGYWDEMQVITSPLILGNGIPAPQLPNLPISKSMALGQDRLDIYRNPNHV